MHEDFAKALAMSVMFISLASIFVERLLAKQRDADRIAPPH